jgi:hypothetical protein
MPLDSTSKILEASSEKDCSGQLCSILLTLLRYIPWLEVFFPGTDFSFHDTENRSCVSAGRLPAFTIKQNLALVNQNP